MHEYVGKMQKVKGHEERKEKKGSHLPFHVLFQEILSRSKHRSFLSIKKQASVLHCFHKCCLLGLLFSISKISSIHFVIQRFSSEQKYLYHQHLSVNRQHYPLVTPNSTSYSLPGRKSVKMKSFAISTSLLAALATSVNSQVI